MRRDNVSLSGIVATFERLLESIVRFQVSRPVLVLCLAAVTVPPAAWIARGLELRTGFGELLPELGTLGLGITWLVGVLSLFGVKLNFLNFVALPIAIGVGSDYAINVLKRREIEGDNGIERAFTETGGAVVACSLTTLSGYCALLFSINGAVRSMGVTAALGEFATQFSAMLILPAFLYWLRNRAQATAPAHVRGAPLDG